MAPVYSASAVGSTMRALMKAVEPACGAPPRTMLPLIARCSRRRSDRVAAAADQGFEAGHSDGDAHLDLLVDDAAVEVVGNLRIDLDAAVHRAGMHDQRVRPGDLELLGVEPEEAEVL